MRIRLASPVRNHRCGLIMRSHHRIRGLVRARSSPHFVAVKEKLPAQNQQPHPQHEAQRTPRNMCAEQRAADRSKHTPGNQLQQQFGVGRAGENQQSAPLPMSVNQKPEHNVSANHLGRRQWASGPSNAALPSAPAPADENPTSAAHREHQPRKQRAAVAHAGITSLIGRLKE